MRSDAVIVSKKAHLFWPCLKGGPSHLRLSRAQNSFLAFRKEDSRQSFMEAEAYNFWLAKMLLRHYKTLLLPLSFNGFWWNYCFIKPLNMYLCILGPFPDSLFGSMWFVPQLINNKHIVPFIGKSVERKTKLKLNSPQKLPWKCEILYKTYSDNSSNCSPSK